MILYIHSSRHFSGMCFVLTLRVLHLFSAEYAHNYRCGLVRYASDTQVLPLEEMRMLENANQDRTSKNCIVWK